VAHYWNGNDSDPGIDVDQTPDSLFDQAMGRAFAEAEERRALQEQLVMDAYAEFVRALRGAGVELKPGDPQKFEIPLRDGTHGVWVEVQS